MGCSILVRSIQEASCAGCSISKMVSPAVLMLKTHNSPDDVQFQIRNSASSSKGLLLFISRYSTFTFTILSILPAFVRHHYFTSTGFRSALPILDIEKTLEKSRGSHVVNPSPTSLSHHPCHSSTIMPIEDGKVNSDHRSCNIRSPPLH